MCIWLYAIGFKEYFDVFSYNFNQFLPIFEKWSVNKTLTPIIYNRQKYLVSLPVLRV